MKKLRQLLVAKRGELMETALQSGSVDKASWEEVERLSKLDAMHEERRWPIALAGLVAVAFWGMQSWGPRETDIDANLTVTEFAFTPQTEREVMSRQSVTRLTADGIQRIELSTRGPLRAPAGSQGCSLTVEAGKGANISVSPSRVPRGMRVRLGVKDGDIRWRFAPASGATADVIPEQIALSSAGVMRLEATCGADRVTLADAGGLVQLLPASSFAVSYVPEKPKFENGIAWEQLTVTERPDAGPGPKSEISSLLEGKIYFNELEGKEVVLRPAEHLAFGASRGELRTLAMDKDSGALKVALHATVQGMKTGAGLAERSRMPSYLEWIYAREWARRFGAGASLFASIYGVLKWLKLVR